jgi:hypothetical protein
LAFDIDSAQTGLCARIDEKPFQLPLGNVQYYRFQCDGSWTSRAVVFVNSTETLPQRGETLEWKPLEGEAPIPLSQSEKPADLHSYASAASPKLLNGSVLVGAAWFSGEYPPRKERDETRGDEIAFGHYRILDRVLFIGRSVKDPVTFLYRANDAKEVKEALEWVFLPEDASEKTKSRFSAIYEVPDGYLLRISEFRDHEGAGADESTHLYAFESGRWRHLASAERIHMY